MSTTVVGAVMLSALLHAHEVLTHTTTIHADSVATLVSTLVPKPLLPPSEVYVAESEDTSEEDSNRIDLGGVKNSDKAEWIKLLRNADSSAKKCLSEGENELIDPRHLVVCCDCGLSSKREHAIPPRKFEEHAFVGYTKKLDSSRANVQAFRQNLLDMLPMRIQLRNVRVDTIKHPLGVSPDTWEAWKEAVKRSTQENDERTTFFFKELQRSHIWTAIFVSSSGGKLEARISGVGVTWFFFVDPPPEQGTLRDIFLLPVARMEVVFNAREGSSFSLVSGIWEVCVPHPKDVKVIVQQEGDRTIPSWRNRLGLTGEYETEFQFESLRITLDSDDLPLKEKIDGVYRAIPKCGGACGSLRVKTGGNAASSMYFFLESGRKTLPEDDRYIFSPFCHRTRYQEYRESPLVLDQAFDPVLNGNPAEGSVYRVEIRGSTLGTWCRCPDMLLDSPCPEGKSLLASVKITSRPALVKQSSTPSSWKRAYQVAGCSIPVINPSCPLAKMYRNMRGTVCDVNLSKSTSVFHDLAFVCSRISLPNGREKEQGGGWIRSWDKTDEVCLVCAPFKPNVSWRAVEKGKTIQFKPIEDGQEAAVYERSLKERPSPWIVRLEGDGTTLDYARFACNAVSLTQRALGCFPRNSFARHCLVDTKRAPDVHHEWRILPHLEKNQSLSKELCFRSNKGDAEAPQPPNFKRFPLRKEQLRSLAWMLSQEDTVEPFWEEEVSESILPSLNWRAEGRVKRPVLVRGGIIADEVGYGKTAITLGLIDASDRSPDPPSMYKDTLIRTQATLVIVPQHLMVRSDVDIRHLVSGQ